MERDRALKVNTLMWLIYSSDVQVYTYISIRHLHDLTNNVSGGFMSLLWDRWRIRRWGTTCNKRHGPKHYSAIKWIIPCPQFNICSLPEGSCQNKKTPTGKSWKLLRYPDIMIIRMSEVSFAINQREAETKINVNQFPHRSQTFPKLWERRDLVNVEYCMNLVPTASSFFNLFRDQALFFFSGQRQIARLINNIRQLSF